MIFASFGLESKTPILLHKTKPKRWRDSQNLLMGMLDVLFCKRRHKTQNTLRCINKRKVMHKR